MAHCFCLYPFAEGFFFSFNKNAKEHLFLELRFARNTKTNRNDILIRR